MGRTFQVNGMTVRVDQELAWAIDGAAPAIEQDDQRLGYISNPAALFAEVPVYFLQSPSVTFTGSVTVTAGAPGEIAQWSLGLGQNVIADNITATYENNFLITQGMQFLVPIRDGEPAELPFSYGGTPLVLNTQAATEESDEPGFAPPTTITWNGANAALTATGGAVSLETFLMLAREGAPRQIVILGRAQWTVSFVAAVNGGDLVWPDPNTVFTLNNLQVGLAQNYDNATIPALGNGQQVPDLREDASGNEYRFGTLTEGGAMRNQWSFNDEDDAIALQMLPNPNVSPSWLAGP